MENEGNGEIVYLIQLGILEIIYELSVHLNFVLKTLVFLKNVLFDLSNFNKAFSCDKTSSHYLYTKDNQVSYNFPLFS